MRFRVVTVALIVLTAGLAFEADRTNVAADAVDTSTYGPIARTAITAVGQQQGQCFPWVQSVVSRATGITIGPDYRLGYLQAGAAEIPAIAARNGDIIQLENDGNTLPTADYPGLHTAIILANRGNGTFQVIDSNSNYDGIVRVRDLDPAADAARFQGISVHIYRLPDSPGRSIAPSVAQPANTATVPLAAGAPALVVADGDCLRVRSGPTIVAGIVACLPSGARINVVNIGGSADGYRWIQIAAGSVLGWAADRYLQGLAPSNDTATPTPTPEPPPTLGKMVIGAVPASGVGLVVFGGGTEQQLAAAAGCNGLAPTFWISDGGTFIPFVSGATITAVNAAWHARFPETIPAGTPLLGRCGSNVTPSTPSATSTPATSTGSVPSGAETGDQTPPAGAASQAPSPSRAQYTVVEGDTLSSIAEQLHPATTTIGAYLDQLYALNGLNNTSLLNLGQVLRLPT